MAKILVVDDEPDMIWAITNVLLSENHSVISVNSGEDALKKISEVTVDLVLLDFRLPGMDGIQILEKIKQIKPDLPVIMVTGYGGIEEAVQAIKLGAAHYIAKPFDNDNLIEIVNKSLQLDILKKDGGVFGKRAAEKIEPRAPEKHVQSSGQSRRDETDPGSKAKNLKIIGIVAFSIMLAAAALYLIARKSSDKEYLIPNSKVSGLSWGGGYLWACDWFNQAVYQYELKDKDLRAINTFTLSGYHITGITWANGSLYTCDSWKKEIFRHYTDSTLSVAQSFPSPGPNPSGLFYDGKYLWSCDGNTKKIYQHALDDRLTVLSTYESPGLFPIGLYHDKKDFWSASAVGMKIFKNNMQERFRLEKTYVYPESFDTAQQISAFTIDNGKIWLAYEGVNKIFRKDPDNLQEVSQ